MPILKPISGRSSAAFLGRYLTAAGRVIDADFINCTDDSRVMGRWWTQMDKARERLGHNSMHGKRPSVKYRHFVLSPDPKDKVEPEGLMGLAREWAERFFAGHQVAIVLHDDNASSVLHAHVVVNASNLATQGRLHIGKKLMREYSEGVQAMAKERGWSSFSPDDGHGREAERGFKAIPVGQPGAVRGDGERRQGAGKGPRSGADFRAQMRAAADPSAYSWKEDLRARVDIALELSRDVRGFVASCNALGVGVGYMGRRRGDGGERDYKFYFLDHTTRACGGARLCAAGPAYARPEVAKRLLRQAASAAAHDAEAVIGHLKGAAYTVVASADASMRISLRDVADTLALNRRYNVSEAADYGRLMAGAEDAATRAELRRAAFIAQAAGVFGHGAARRAGTGPALPAAPVPAKKVRDMTREEMEDWVRAYHAWEVAAGRVKYKKSGGGNVPPAAAQQAAAPALGHQQQHGQR